MNKNKIRAAMSIISGRIKNPSDETLIDLGYDPYRFRGYGPPSLNEIKEKCEEIVVDLFDEIDKGLNKESECE